MLLTPSLQFTVPLLLDTVTRRIVCNESALIMRDINSCFDSLARFPAVNLRPPHMVDAIDSMNDAMCARPSLTNAHCNACSTIHIL